jgi:hypothetical protein
MDSAQFGHNIERRREILYGTPGTVIYRDGKPVLWIPDSLGKVTRELSQKDLEALRRELMKYLKPDNPGEMTG